MAASHRSRIEIKGPSAPRPARGRLPGIVLLALLATSCATARRVPVDVLPGKKAEPPPAWLRGDGIAGKRVCGVGVAGKTWQNSGNYAREAAENRAIENLAGVLETKVEEAIIDRETQRGTSVRTARVLSVDEDLIERVRGMAETEFWFDTDGTGPFEQPAFTYALSCVDAAQAASELKVDADTLQAGGNLGISSPRSVPKWITRTGKQPGNRLCAVGFTMPMFYATSTFEAVVEDIRGQLARVIETLVSTYYEEQTTERGQRIESMTVATTQAMSQGVVVTHFWYDRDGIGPFAKKRTTYGWGCVYPVTIIEKAAAAAAPPPTNERDREKALQQVRERAASAFDALDAEELKRAPAPDAKSP